MSTTEIGNTTLAFGVSCLESQHLIWRFFVWNLGNWTCPHHRSFYRIEMHILRQLLRFRNWNLIYKSRLFWHIAVLWFELSIKHQQLRGSRICKLCEKLLKNISEKSLRKIEGLLNKLFRTCILVCYISRFGVFFQQTWFGNHSHASDLPPAENFVNYVRPSGIRNMTSRRVWFHHSFMSKRQKRFEH